MEDPLISERECINAIRGESVGISGLKKVDLLSIRVSVRVRFNTRARSYL